MSSRCAFHPALVVKVAPDAVFGADSRVDRDHLPGAPGLPRAEGVNVKRSVLELLGLSAQAADGTTCTNEVRGGLPHRLIVRVAAQPGAQL